MYLSLSHYPSISFFSPVSKTERKNSCLTIHLLQFIDFSYEAMLLGL